ncbi:unnamed protein product [Nesidiocoris tenuis]|uniref:Uncharacterized protein n=1 Tax=Nesidiocoris tenuis TaxID=355587 RepID=A0A6H5GB62_9HEMI|nr:unnamed protein product [Nesidiocoris tenuis]
MFLTGLYKHDSQQRHLLERHDVNNPITRSPRWKQWEAKRKRKRRHENRQFGHICRHAGIRSLGVRGINCKGWSHPPPPARDPHPRLYRPTPSTLALEYHGIILLPRNERTINFSKNSTAERNLSNKAKRLLLNALKLTQSYSQTSVPCSALDCRRQEAKPRTTAIKVTSRSTRETNANPCQKGSLTKYAEQQSGTTGVTYRSTFADDRCRRLCPRRCPTSRRATRHSTDCWPLIRTPDKPLSAFAVSSIASTAFGGTRSSSLATNIPVPLHNYYQVPGGILFPHQACGIPFPPTETFFPKASRTYKELPTGRKSISYNTLSTPRHVHFEVIRNVAAFRIMMSPRGLAKVRK